MTFKVAIVQAAAANGTPTYTQDFTDSTAGFASDVKAAILIGSSGTSNSASTAKAQMSVSAVAGSSAASTSFAVSDAVATAAARRRPSVTDLYTNQQSTGAGLNGSATFNSFLSNGLRVNWTDQSLGELITVVLLGGDIEAAVSVGQFTGAAAPETVVVTHGLTATPEVIFAFAAQDSVLDTGTAAAQMGLGFWVGGNYAASSFYTTNGGTGDDTGIDVNTDGIINTPQNPTTRQYVHTLSSVGATTFSATSSGVTLRPLYFLSLRGTTAPLIAECGVHTTPTSTGNATIVTGFRQRPELLLTIPSRSTALGILSGTDAGCFGLHAAAFGAGTTQYGGAACSDKDGANPSVAKSRANNSAAIKVLDDTGAVNVASTVNSWDKDGITLNYSAVAASAFKVPYLTIAQHGKRPGSYLGGPILNSLGGGFVRRGSF